DQPVLRQYCGTRRRLRDEPHSAHVRGRLHRDVLSGENLMTRLLNSMRGVNSMHTRLGAALLVMSVLTTGCDLNLVNPNSPTEATVLTTDDGILGLAVGIQDQFAGGARHY